MFIQALPNGQTYQYKDWTIFFGNKEFKPEQLSQIQTHQICTLHQVHGDSLVYATPQEKVAADAHWSFEKQHLLVIRTADCLPLFIIEPLSGIKIAIHSGWKGVDLQITKKAIQRLNPKLSHLQVFIGPHILMKSFEVSPAVAFQLMNHHKIENLNLKTRTIEHELLSQFLKETSLQLNDFCFQIKDKFFVNLLALTKWQLYQFGILPKQIICLEHDTKTNLDYCSYRRDYEIYKKDNGYRNLSFIYYNPQP